ncbi:GntR family transcriptional regulator [Microbacterium sp. USHLN186]|uniref:GntR family transcriptional regulator n=1 Tax=Microbacterium sp. USHLN186 TaxID=3081286 RepID=UPI00301B4032
MVMERSAGLESVRVADSLRDDIIFGRRPPGSRLVERDIAAELKVSRLPVREAIKALVADGIVVARPRSWATVRRFSEQDVQDFAEVREAVETLAFVLTTKRIDDVGLALLESLVTQEATAAALGDTESALEASAAFHMAAVRLSENAMLIELADSLVTRLRWLFGQHEDLVGMAATHRVILEAIRDRDVEAVERLIPEHLAQGRAVTRERLFGSVEEPD